MDWRHRPRNKRIGTLVSLGLRLRDAIRTDLLAQAAEQKPQLANPLVGGWAHPTTLVVHDEHTTEEGEFACGTVRKRAYFEVTPSKLKANPGLKPCRRCFTIKGIA